MSEDSSATSTSEHSSETSSSSRESDSSVTNSLVVGNSCAICCYEYSVTRPEVQLPCNLHSFCTDCIYRLEKDNDTKCPNCKYKWTKSIIEEPFLLYMNLMAELDPEERDFETLEEPDEILCSDHDKQAQFWCKCCANFLCCKCVTTIHKKHDFELMEESFSDIKSYLKTDLEAESKEIWKDLTDQRREIDKAYKDVDFLRFILSFVQNKLGEVSLLLPKMKASESKLLHLHWSLEECRQAVENIDMEQLSTYLTKYRLLEKKSRQSKVIKRKNLKKEISLMLLREERKSRRSLISSVENQTLRTTFLQTFTKETEAASEKYKAGRIWDVVGPFEGIAVAAAIRTKEPYFLQISPIDTKQHNLFVHAVEAIFQSSPRKTDVRLRCLNAFYNNDEKSKDQCTHLIRLCTLYKDACHLTQIFGWFDLLDLNEIEQLDVPTLGLPLDNARDIVRLCDEDFFRDIRFLHIAVPWNLPMFDELDNTPLPDYISSLTLHFYKGKSSDIENIRTNIASIIPGKQELYCIYFVLCQFSQEDYLRIAQLLEGLKIHTVRFAVDCIDYPLTSEKDLIKKKLQETVMCKKVVWIKYE